MEIPFDYILISIMINLKNRKVKAEVSKQSLIKIINKIIYKIIKYSGENIWIRD